VGAAVVFNYRYPGKYAINVLAGALESAPSTQEVPLDFPRDLPGLIAAARTRLEAGARVLAAWSFYSPGLEGARDELAAFRKEVPSDRVTCIAGGVHASAEPLATLEAGFDCVAVGEGEQTLVDLVSHLDRGESLRGVRGMAFLDGGRMAQTGRAEPIRLDDFPPFAAGLRRFGSIEITRGCVYACRFCQTPFMNRARFRHRSVENVRHWAEVAARANLRDVRFITPTSLSYGSADTSVNLPAVEAMLAAVREAIGPRRRLYYGTFPSEVRPEHVTSEALRLLRRYVDNDNLIIGGQSGSERILAATHRGHDVASIERAARLALEHGFLPNVDFIFGLPGEEADDTRDSLALMRRLVDLGARVHGHTFMPLPGTPYRDAAPGRLDAATLSQLDAFIGRGNIYGQWRRQADPTAAPNASMLPAHG
jgi:B12-binding domain/radical SAM domain protein